MPVFYLYDLWNGKEVVGQFKSSHLLFGHYVEIPYESQIKLSYRSTIKSIRVPIIYRKIYDDGVQFTVRVTLDVRRKSKRQIDLINNERKNNNDK